MSENTSGSSKKRKVLSATLAVAMVATMLLSGTLAYFYSADATNIIEGTQKEVIGHDDLVKVNSGLYNKDIYAENTGNSRAFVRIRLSESLSLDGTEVVPEAAKVIHTIKQEEIDGVKTNVDKHIVKNETGDAYVDYTATDPIHEDFAWTMGGTGKYFLSKASGDYPPAAVNTIRTYYLETNGVAHDNRNTKITETQVQGVPEKYGNAPACSVITMAAYKALAKETSASGRNEQLSFCGWVIDTDGWAYWSQPLRPGEATGLLLNQVEVKNPKDFGNREFEYKIHVEYQAVDDDDMGIWLGSTNEDAEGVDRSAVEEATADAKTMLQYLQTKKEYPAESKKILNEIYEAMAKTAYAPVKALYAYALEHAEDAVYDSIYSDEEQRARAAEAKAAAERLEAAIEADPTLLTTPCDLTGIDEKIKAYVIANYGKNGGLTKAEAASVSMIRVSGEVSITGVSNADDCFPNLKRLQLNNPKMTTITLPAQLNKLREFVVTGDDTKQVKSIDYTASAATIEDLHIVAPGLQSLNATDAKPGINIDGTTKWVYLAYTGPAPSPDAFNIQSATNLVAFNLSCKKVENDAVVNDWDATLLNGGLTLNCPKLTNFTLVGGFTTADADPIIDLSACPRLQAMKINENGLAVTCKVSDQAKVRTDLSMGIKVVPTPTAPTPAP